MKVSLSKKGKQEFLNIIKTIQKSYQGTIVEKSQSYKFREKLLTYPVEKLSIVVTYLKEYEYKINAWIEDESLSLEEREHSWITVDGVQELRDQSGTQKSWKLAFSINCLTDIVEREKQSVA